MDSLEARLHFSIFVSSDRQTMLKSLPDLKPKKVKRFSQDGEGDGLQHTKFSSLSSPGVRCLRVSPRKARAPHLPKSVCLVHSQTFTVSVIHSAQSVCMKRRQALKEEILSAVTQNLNANHKQTNRRRDPYGKKRHPHSSWITFWPTAHLSSPFHHSPHPHHSFRPDTLFVCFLLTH